MRKPSPSSSHDPSAIAKQLEWGEEIGLALEAARSQPETGGQKVKSWHLKPQQRELWETLGSLEWACSIGSEFLSLKASKGSWKR